MINPNLEWDTSKDPSLLFGRLIERGYEDLFDASKFAAFKQRLEVLRAPAAAGRVLLVYGSGCLVEEVRGLYDIKCYFDVTPKERSSASAAASSPTSATRWPLRPTG